MSRGKCQIARCHTCDQEEQMNENGVRCGNEHHPRGAWHIATPLPMATIFGWSKAERRYRNNIRKWGCGCERHPGCNA